MSSEDIDKATDSASHILPTYRGSDPALGGFRHVLPINIGVTLATATCTSILLLPELPWSWIVVWWLALSVPSAYMLARWFFAAPDTEPDRRRWRRYDFAMAVASGLTWGAGALFLPHLTPRYQMLLILVSAGMIAGASATMAMVPRAAAIYMLAASLPYIGYMLLEGDPLSFGTGILGSIYVVAMLVANRVINGVIRRSRTLREENTVLYERIRAAQAELLDIAESSEAFALYDADGRLHLWNQRFPALLGLDAASLQPGRPLAEILDRAGLPPALLSPGAMSGKVFELPNRRWLRAGYRETPHGDQALILIDVTEQQQASAQLHAQNQRLEELFRQVSAARDEALRASQAKSIFLANVSHELRTPLNAIIGFSDIIRRQMFGSGSEKYVEYVEDIHGSGQHLLNIINDILDLARIEANQIVLNETAVTIAEEVAACSRLASQQYGDNAVLVTVLPDDLPTLRADARLLRQILLNLLGNAMKFSPPGAAMEIGAQVNRAGEIEIWVHDHGIGIAPADQVRIFEPFEQADTQLGRKYGGLGLGLSLVRAFVAAHQGRLDIDSDVGRGTRITAIFPASRTGAPPIEAPSSSGDATATS